MAEGTDHDQLFKEVIREFFPDFLMLFFPEQAARYDLQKVAWLDKEVFADPPDGPRHLLDLVAELTRLDGKAGDTALALIHVELESAESVTDIERRLPDYYFYLRRTTGKPVLPVVVFLKVGLDGLGTREITDRFDGEPTMTLRYRYVGLPGLPAAEYLRGDNWLGVALSALMKAPKEWRIAYGTEAMARLGEAPLPDGKKSLLGDCVESYIDIPEEDSRKFQDILEANATGRVPIMHKTRVQVAREKGIEEGIERGIEKGIEQGREEGIEQGIEQGVEQGLEAGRLQGQRAAVTELLEARFSAVPPGVAAQLASIADPVELRRILIAAGTSPTVEEFLAAADR